MLYSQYVYDKLNKTTRHHSNHQASLLKDINDGPSLMGYH